MYITTNIAIKVITLFTSALFAILPCFLASFFFLGVGSSVLSLIDNRNPTVPIFEIASLFILRVPSKIDGIWLNKWCILLIKNGNAIIINIIPINNFNGILTTITFNWGTLFDIKPISNSAISNDKIIGTAIFIPIIKHWTNTFIT